MSRTLVLTAEDMADLIAGHTINVPLSDGEEVIASAPDGVNHGWIDPALAVINDWTDEEFALALGFDREEESA